MGRNRQPSPAVDEHTRRLIIAVVVVMGHEFGHAELGQPVRDDNHVLGEVEIVEARVRILFGALANDERTEHAVSSLETWCENQSQGQCCRISRQEGREEEEEDSLLLRSLQPFILTG